MIITTTTTIHINTKSCLLADMETKKQKGMYNTPSFTLARALGGMTNWYWVRYKGDRHSDSSSTIVILASGLILGEGVSSIFNLIMAAVGLPHL